MEVDRAGAEPAFVQELEIHADVLGERALAASDHDGHEEQLVRVHEPGFDRLRREVGAADGQITRRRRLQSADRLGSSSRSIRVLALVTLWSVFE